MQTSRCQDSRKENAVSQLKVGNDEKGRARATRQVERGKQVLVETVIYKENKAVNVLKKMFY